MVRRPFVPVKPGQTYWVSVWARGKGRLRVFTAEYGAATAAKYLFARPLARIPLREQWDRYDLEYVVPPTTIRKQPFSHVRWALYVMPGGTAYLDDVQVRRMAHVPSPVAPLLGN